MDIKNVVGMFKELLEGNDPSGTIGPLNDILEDLEVPKIENNHTVYWHVYYYDGFTDNFPLTEFSKDSFFTEIEATAFCSGLERCMATTADALEATVVMGTTWEEFVHELCSNNFIDMFTRNEAIKLGEGETASLYDMESDTSSEEDDDITNYQ